MTDDGSRTDRFESGMRELISLLRDNDVTSGVIEEFMDRHHGVEVLGDFQGILDIKELLDVGLVT